MWEDIFDDAVDDSFWAEVKFYERLKDFQDIIIPRFYGTVEMRFSVERISVAGVLMEYMPGTALENLADPYVLRSHRSAIVELFVSVSKFHFMCVIHHDIRPANVLLQFNPNLRLILFDFGPAMVRHEDIDEKHWEDLGPSHVDQLIGALNAARVRDASPYVPDKDVHPDDVVPEISITYVLDERWMRVRRWYDPPERAGEYDAVMGGPHKWYRVKRKVEKWGKVEGRTQLVVLVPP